MKLKGGVAESSKNERFFGNQKEFTLKTDAFTKILRKYLLFSRSCVCLASLKLSYEVLGVSQNTFTHSVEQSKDLHQSSSSIQGKAAFYDVDGTLMDANVLHPYAYYALSVPSITGKIGRLAKLGASLPLYAWADRRGRKFFNDLFYYRYK